MFCPNCGSSYEGNPRFCPNCGAPIQQGNPQNQQNYSQQYNYQPSGGYHVPIPQRSIATCVILSIVTCGIYGLYWLACLVDNLNTAAQYPQDTTGGTVLLLTLVTCGIYGLYWLYKAGEKVNRIHQFNGEYTDSTTSVLYLLLGIFGFSIISYCLIQSELNKVASC